MTTKPTEQELANADQLMMMTAQQDGRIPADEPQVLDLTDAAPAEPELPVISPDPGLGTSGGGAPITASTSDQIRDAREAGDMKRLQDLYRQQTQESAEQLRALSNKR